MAKSYFTKRYKPFLKEMPERLGGWLLRSTARLVACLAYVAGYEMTILKNAVSGESPQENASTDGETGVINVEQSMKMPDEDELESLMPECEHNYAEIIIRNDLLITRCTKCHRTKGTPMELISEEQMDKLGSEFTQAIKNSCVGQA